MYQKQRLYTVNHWWSQGTTSQVHSIITQLKVPNYKVPGGHHSMFTPCRPARHNYKEPYTPQGLFTADHVFRHQDLGKHALSPLYKGVYRVLIGTNKAYQLDMSGIIDWISIDRLKSAYMETAFFDTYTLSDRKCFLPQKNGFIVTSRVGVLVT